MVMKRNSRNSQVVATKDLDITNYLNSVVPSLIQALTSFSLSRAKAKAMKQRIKENSSNGKSFFTKNN